MPTETLTVQKCEDLEAALVVLAAKLETIRVTLDRQIVDVETALILAECRVAELKKAAH